MKRILFLIVLLVTTVLSAQNLSGIKVDDLSDAQIRSILAQGKAQGLDVEDGEQVALSMGLSQTEAAKFKARVARLEGGVVPDAVKVKTGALYTTEVEEKGEAKREEKSLSQKDSLDAKLPVAIYGQEVFRQADLKIFERSQDARAPSNYIVGSGDQLGVSVFGTAFFQKEYTVDSRGNIAMDNWGKLNVRGLTFEQVQKLIRARVSPYFNMSSNDMTVTLSYSRTITVNIVGEVQQPGSYKMPAINTAFNALVAAGGPSNSGTLRDIQVLRNGQIVKSLDVYAFLLNPNSKQEFYLEDNDYLFVGPAANVVQIGGEITRPMAYELLPEESVTDLLRYAGGATAKAYAERVQIQRQGENELALMDVTASAYAATLLERGDRIIVPTSNADMRRYVQIDGAVMQPDRYGFFEGMNVGTLISKAGGTLPDIMRKEAFISRTDLDQTQTFISFSLEEALDKGGPVLQNKDVVHILGVPQQDTNMAVNIKGAVRSPKKIDYAKGLTLGDVLRLAGGLAPNASYTNVEVYRLNTQVEYNLSKVKVVHELILTTEVPKALLYTLDIEDPLLQFLLQPYDEVVVRAVPNFNEKREVWILGEVARPGSYLLESIGDKLDKVIDRSGGFSQDADVENATLLRVNTQNVVFNLKTALDRPSSYDNVILQDGDTILVPRQNSLISIVGSGTNYAQVNGEQIMYFPFEKGKRVKYYVNTYGLGYGKNAARSAAFVSYPNGKFSRSKKYGLFYVSPIVKESAKIYVQVKPIKEKDKRERKPIDMNQALATVTSAITGFATVYILVTR